MGQYPVLDIPEMGQAVAVFIILYQAIVFIYNIDIAYFVRTHSPGVPEGHFREELLTFCKKGTKQEEREQKIAHEPKYTAKLGIIQVLALAYLVIFGGRNAAFDAKPLPGAWYAGAAVRGMINERQVLLYVSGSGAI